MRGTRTDRSNKYTPVPQAVSDEDEGVYDESPESSQQMELISAEGIPADGKSMVFTDDFHQQDLQTLDFCSTGSRQGARTPQPITFIETQSPNKSSKMSLSRQVCLLISISVCIAYMVALLWLIPCQMAPCNIKNGHRTLPLQLKEWNKIFPAIRFVSKPQLIKLRESQALILLAFQLLDHNASSLEKKTKEVIGGVIALRGEDGREVWRCPFYSDVLEVACHTDVNNDGIVDCAVLGSSGLLATVNASNGHTFWFLHDHDDRSAQINVISSPCFLNDMDFDRDGVDDFVITGVMTYDGFRNNAEATPIPSWQTYEEQVVHVGLLLVSGSNGQIIGQPLPIPDIHTPGSSIGYRKIHNLIVYSLGNSTKSLLLLLGGGDGSRINQQNNPDTVLMLSIDDLYTGATRDRKSEDPFNVEFRNVYSAKGNIHSITIMENIESKAGDLLLLTNNEEELICLDGANELRMKWMYNKENMKISKPVLGRFSVADIMDIFIILTPLNCSSCDCNSEIVVLNGKDGQEVTHAFTKSMAFNPIVLYNNSFNATDKFLFKKAMLANESVGQEIKLSEEKMTNSNDEEKLKNQSIVFLSGYNNFRHRPTDTSVPISVYSANINLEQGKSTKASLWNAVLMEFQKERGFLKWEIDLPSISQCHGLNTEDDNDIIFEDPKFSLAYLLTIGESNGTTKIDMINLNTRSSSSSSNKAASAMLHPTSE